MSKVLSYNDLRVGDEWTSPAREITADDVRRFASLSGDLNPLHVDPAYAGQTPFRRPIAHGLLGLAVVGGLGSTSPALADVVLLGIREWAFLQPVYYGDRVHVVNRVLELLPYGRRRGRVIWQRSLVNQQGQVVQRGTLETLVRRYQPAAHPASPTSTAISVAGT